jgi:hypothetical protein
MAIKTTVALLMAIVILSLATLYLGLNSAQKDKTILDLEKKLKETSEELLNLQSRLAEYRYEKSELTKQIEEIEKLLEKERWNYSQWMYIVGIHEGKGEVVILRGEIKKGAGELLINTEKVLLDPDFQLSMRTAYGIAINFTGKNLDKDIVLKLEHPKEDTVLVEGQSAGAAMAILMIALMEEKRINTSVIITGKVEKDGRITKVVSIKEKAEAASSVGDLLLVPKGQVIKVGIKVLEVENVKDAIEYFFE